MGPTSSAHASRLGVESGAELIELLGCWRRDRPERATTRLVPLSLSGSPTHGQPSIPGGRASVRLSRSRSLSREGKGGVGQRRPVLPTTDHDELVRGRTLAIAGSTLRLRYGIDSARHEHEGRASGFSWAEPGPGLER